MIFDELKINDVILPNRVTVAPMCQYSAVNGCPTSWHYGHLSQLLTSGAGMVMLESTSVSLDGRITSSDLSLASDNNFKSIQKLFSFLRNINDTPIGIQISHAGRKGSSYVPWIKHNTSLVKTADAWPTVSASNIAKDSGWPEPKKLSLTEMQQIIYDFESSAKVSKNIGFDALEVHMAHGYLLHQFFSPVSNKRKDVYGGSLKNRCRFLLEISNKVRKIWPRNKILGARVTGCDWLGGGSTIDDCVFLTNKLKDIGFDYVCVSSGGILPITNLVFKPGYQTHLSKEVRSRTGILTRTAGMITSTNQVNEILKEGSADFVAVARKFIQDPRWLYRHNNKIIPFQYQKCFPG
jgi:2,4-dienoyl-CoA reductase-like NADH-dependent reductase (Old Yellow Enzyme family)